MKRTLPDMSFNPEPLAASNYWISPSRFCFRTEPGDSAQNNSDDEDGGGRRAATRGSWASRSKDVFMQLLSDITKLDEKWYAPTSFDIPSLNAPTCSKYVYICYTVLGWIRNYNVLVWSKMAYRYSLSNGFVPKTNIVHCKYFRFLHKTSTVVFTVISCHRMCKIPSV